MITWRRRISLPSRSGPERSWLHWLPWLVALVGAAWLLRAPFLDREFWNLDEASTFTMAQQLRSGATLYRDAADNRSPLVPFLQASVFALAGDWNFRAQHVALALGYGLSAFGLLALARRLGRAAAGAWSALAFTGLAFLLPGILDALGAHTEAYVVFCSTLGFWLLARALSAGGFLAGLPVGCAFAASSLCKQPGALDFGVAVLLVALLAWRQPRDRLRLGRLLVGAAVAFATAWVATAVYFWARGAWRDFVYYAWEFNTRLYVPAVPLAERLAMGRLTWTLGASWAPALLGAAVPGLLIAAHEAWRGWIDRTRPLPLLPWLTLGWLAAAVASTMLSGRDFPHYAIQAVPGLSLAAGLTLDRLASWARRIGPTRRWRLILAGAALAALVAALTHDFHRFRQLLWPHDDPSQAALRTVVQRYTTPADPILVWGYYPEGYAASRRLPATRFIYTNYLTGLIPWTNLAPEIDTRDAVVPGAWEAFWRDYAARPPQLILASSSRGYLKYPLLSQPRLRDEIIEHFADLGPEIARTTGVTVYRRLAPLTPLPPPAKSQPDAALQLTANRLTGQTDLVALRVTAPAGTTDLVLRLGGQPYRRLACPADAPTDVLFLVRISDLARLGPVADVLGQRAGQVSASAALDVARRLLLVVRRHEPTPVLDHGTDRLAPRAPLDAGWQAEPRQGAPGWRHAGPFTLSFVRPPAAQVLEFLWQPAASTPALTPEVVFLAPGRSPEILPTTSTPLASGILRLNVELPRGDPGDFVLRSNAPGEVWLGELRGFAHGPRLQFGPQAFPPASAIQNNQERLIPAPDGSWDAHAFARLIYPRSPGMEALLIDYGVRDSALAESGGAAPDVIIEVNYLHDDGRSENLMSRGLQPVARPADRGLQHSRVNLPAFGTGAIEIRFVPMQPGNPRNRSYLLDLRAQGSGPDLRLAPDRWLVPAESESNDADRIHLQNEDGWLTHAPSRIAYDCPADLRAISFGFGLDAHAIVDEHGWRRSDGIDLIVDFLDPAGTVTRLYQRSLQPFDRPADRGPQPVRLELPGRAGRLVLRLTPGPKNDPAFDWSYLTDLRGETAAPLARP